MKATQFRTRFFEKGSEPDMNTLKKCNNLKIYTQKYCNP